MELREAEKELCHLGFRAEVVKKEKELLAQFADHVSKVHSMEVSSHQVFIFFQPVCTCICVCLFPFWSLVMSKICEVNQMIHYQAARQEVFKCVLRDSMMRTSVRSLACIVDKGTSLCLWH